MPIRRIILSTARYYGFVSVCLLFSVGPPATKLIHAGFSGEEIAQEMNRLWYYQHERGAMGGAARSWRDEDVCGSWHEPETRRASPCAGGE